MSGGDCDPWSRVNRTKVSRQSRGGADTTKSESCIPGAQCETYLDVEIGRIAEDGADALCLCMHVNFLDFAWFCFGVGLSVLEGVFSEGCRESGLVGLLGGCREGRGGGHVVGLIIKIKIVTGHFPPGFAVFGLQRRPRRHRRLQ